jgi:hypothetical protein
MGTTDDAVEVLAQATLGIPVGGQVPLIDTPYPIIPELVVSGTRCERNSLQRHRLSPVATSLPEPEALDRAALVWRSADAAVGGFISEYCKPSFLERIQKEVMDGVRIPQF